ncbi:MAG TPA: zinc-binding dehydrogenase [Acidimicrobiales bacterium]|nr:zinc-binding dehydrogenase [Acidimicrobiales bacterium]
MRNGRRMVFVGPGRPLECHESEVASPAPGGLVVRTTIAGVCGTDAHRLDGDLPDPGRPVTFGHEGIGVVEELGAGVTADLAGVALRVGDTVYWSPSSREPGIPSELGWPPPAELANPAAYQDYATLPPSNMVYRVPDDTDAEAVIAFGCAMPTALGGMARLGGVRPGHSVVVQGSGPVGLAATFLAGLTAARQVIVIGAPDNRLVAAARLGASTTIPLERTTVEERRASILDLTDGRGADVVIEAAGRMNAFDEGMNLLADNGRYVVLGIYSGHGQVALDAVRLNNRNLSVIGSMGGTQLSDYRTTIYLAQRHGARLGFAELITHRFGLTDLEDAIAVARAGDAIKAIVLPALDPHAAAPAS